MTALTRTGFVVLALVVTAPIASAQTAPTIPQGDYAVALIDSAGRMPPGTVRTDGRYAVASGATLQSISVRITYYNVYNQAVGLEDLTATTVANGISCTAQSPFPPPNMAVKAMARVKITVTVAGVMNPLEYASLYNGGQYFWVQ